MLIVAPTGYALTSDNVLRPVAGGCLHVSGGRLLTDGSIMWDGPLFAGQATPERKNAH